MANALTYVMHLCQDPVSCTRTATHMQQHDSSDFFCSAQWARGDRALSVTAQQHDSSELLLIKLTLSINHACMTSIAVAATMEVLTCQHLDRLPALEICSRASIELSEMGQHYYDIIHC